MLSNPSSLEFLETISGTLHFHGQNFNSRYYLGNSLLAPGIQYHKHLFTKNSENMELRMLM